MGLSINEENRTVLDKIIQKLPQSLLITGPARAGLSTIGLYIAKSKDITPTIILPEKDEKIDLTSGVINVSSMRRLYDETKTKILNERIIIIDYAERMTTQAQNAFLKLLEEPNANTYFILVSNSTSKLLPTVLSRVETLNIKPITIKQSNDLLDDLGVTNATKRSQLLFIAGGLPAEMIKLAGDEEYLEKRSSIVRDARELISGRLYEKLRIAHKYRDDRPSTLVLLSDAANILKKTVLSNPQPDLLKFIDKLINTQQRIEANGNIRLALAQLSI
jgi:DNA polymerase III subunit delta'